MAKHEIIIRDGNFEILSSDCTTGNKGCLSVQLHRVAMEMGYVSSHAATSETVQISEHVIEVRGVARFSEMSQREDGCWAISNTDHYNYRMVSNYAS